jgi:hypothetical protein
MGMFSLVRLIAWFRAFVGLDFELGRNTTG